jgi:hypothetical protein
MNTDLVYHHSRAQGMDYWVLYTIARNAADDGTVTMSVRQIADGARVSQRSVQRCRGNLVKLGELEVTFEPHHDQPATYRVIVRQMLEQMRRQMDAPAGGRASVAPLIGAYRTLQAVPNNGNGAA